MLAAISSVKTSRKIQPRVHVMRPAGTKRSAARMTNMTTRRLIVERHCTALTPLGLRAVAHTTKSDPKPAVEGKISKSTRLGSVEPLRCFLLYTSQAPQIGKINSAFGSFGPLNSLWFSRVAAQSGDDSLSKMSCGGVGINSKMPNQRDVYIESVKRNFDDLQG